MDSNRDSDTGRGMEEVAGEQATGEDAIASLSFEAALRELEEIVGRLESGDTPLEQAIRLYERGSALRQRCAERLDAAQARIEAIRLGADGKPAGTQPFAAG